MFDFYTIINSVNQFFAFIAPISDAFWDFPTQYTGYKNIPILGQFSFAVILLMGMGIFFSYKTRFIQWETFKLAVPIMRQENRSKIGVSAFASFILGLAMRAGPGNIVGITGAITIGGPGALFWMWVAAFFGMATAFIESVLAQMFKEKKNDEYVGGLPFYGQKLLFNLRSVGIFLSLVYIIYALFNIPIQTFNVFSSIGILTETATKTVYARESILYFIISALLIFSIAFIIFGGIHRVARYSEILVPLKAILFVGISLFIIILNIKLLPYFFKEVIFGAFSPQALFGGSIGIALAQGVKRGLMSNEAGQGTMTMAAAVANNRHPCEQGFVQSLGVFIDTFLICSMTGFIVVLAHLWVGTSGTEWDALRSSKIGYYLASAKSLVPGTISDLVKILLCICYGLFAFTALLGMISFAEVSANFISKSPKFILFIRILGALVFVPFGTLTFLANLELGNLWYLSDLMNIIMVYLNIPLLLIGLPIVLKALAHYRKTKGTHFYSDEIGVKTAFWNKNQE